MAFEMALEYGFISLLRITSWTASYGPLCEARCCFPLDLLSLRPQKVVRPFLEFPLFDYGIFLLFLCSMGRDSVPLTGSKWHKPRMTVHLTVAQASN